MRKLALKEVRVLGKSWGFFSLFCITLLSRPWFTHLFPWPWPPNFVSLWWYLSQPGPRTLSALVCHSVDSRERNHVFHFRPHEKRISIYQVPIVYRALFSFLLLMPHHYFVKEESFISFNRWRHWNLEKLRKFLWIHSKSAWFSNPYSFHMPCSIHTQ